VTARLTHGELVRLLTGAGIEVPSKPNAARIGSATLYLNLAPLAALRQALRPA